VEDNNMEDYEATVNVTYAGANGDLPDPVPFDTTDAVIRGLIEEAIRTGSLPGVATDADVDLSDYVVDRFPATPERTHNVMFLRPKTPFGV
jgi:hypothetical protein